MTARKTKLKDRAFAAGGMAATACAASLRGVHSLAASAPAGRAFAAIATLTELSGRVEERLVAGKKALTGGDRDGATLELAHAVVLMDKMLQAAALPPEQSEPAYLRRRRYQADI